MLDPNKPPTKLSDRRWPWLYEKDGSLNPTWLMATVTWFTGIAATIVAFIVALATNDSTPLKYAYGFIALTLVALLISALPRDRAKILAQSRAVSAGLQALQGSPEPNLFLDDERDFRGRVGE